MSACSCESDTRLPLHQLDLRELRIYHRKNLERRVAATIERASISVRESLEERLLKGSSESVYRFQKKVSKI